MGFHLRNLVDHIKGDKNRRIRKKDISAPFNFVANNNIQSPDDLAHPQTTAWGHAESSPENNFFSLTQDAELAAAASAPDDSIRESREFNPHVAGMPLPPADVEPSRYLTASDASFIARWVHRVNSGAPVVSTRSELTNEDPGSEPSDSIHESQESTSHVVESRPPPADVHESQESPSHVVESRPPSADVHPSRYLTRSETGVIARWLVRVKSGEPLERRSIELTNKNSVEATQKAELPINSIVSPHTNRETARSEIPPEMLQSKFSTDSSSSATRSRRSGSQAPIAEASSKYSQNTQDEDSHAL